jgi:hypothetical protein
MHFSAPSLNKKKIKKEKKKKEKISLVAHIYTMQVLVLYTLSVALIST